MRDAGGPHPTPVRELTRRHGSTSSTPESEPVEEAAPATEPKESGSFWRANVS